MKDTKERILDTAEKLFAQNGFDNVSVRTIMAEADLNLALAHYHFKSRQLLIQEVLKRRLTALNEERLRLLMDLLVATARPTVRQVLRSFLKPVIDLLEGHPEFARFLGQVYASPDQDLRLYFGSFFTDVLHQYSAIMRKLLPENLSESQLICRAHFLFGAMSYTISNFHDVELISEGRAEVLRGEALLDELVSFCEAGLTAVSET